MRRRAWNCSGLVCNFSLAETICFTPVSYSNKHVKSRGYQGNVCGRETRPVNGDGSPCRFIDELCMSQGWTLRQGSNERDRSSPPERSRPVILSEAKDQRMSLSPECSEGETSRCLS